MRTVKRLLGRSLFASHLDALLLRNAAVVVAFHRVLAGADVSDTLTVDPQTFEAFCRFFRRHFSVVPLPELIAKLERGRTLRRELAITFDDGYRDNYECAFPILRQRNAPAMFFVATGFVDEPRLPWWDEIAFLVRATERATLDLRPWCAEPVVVDRVDREATIVRILRTYKQVSHDQTAALVERLRAEAACPASGDRQIQNLWMTWDMLREMQSAGMTIGGHTVTHPVLSRMTCDDQRREISGCGATLQAEMGQPMRYFSYPVGGLTAFNDNTRTCLREAGVSYAFSYYGGFRRYGDWDDYDIRRMAVESYTTDQAFRAMITLPQVFDR